ncbi:MAG: methyl-accepting chemotaxis protein [Rhodobacteraceae bacterium]|nr:methyl-accepting chemotaxis protein [Paracoccaceae bacterium]MCZ8081879.1 methyl-accepting chemotaxis protein [Paracoccaceae bacterium]
MHGRGLKTTIDNIAERVETFGRINDKVVMQSHMLAVNSMIESARAGQHGRGFSIVAQEMKRLSDQTKDNADQFRLDVMSIVQTAITATGDLLQALDGAAARALMEKAQALVQLIVRNLFERTADVRWWATDSAFWQVLNDPVAQRLTLAEERLRTIHRYYTVYCDLVLTDMEGRVIASARGGSAARAQGLPPEALDWFGRARGLASGHDYVVSGVHRSSLHENRKVLVYATAVRDRGQAEGAAVGVLAVFFDWQKEAQIIVRNEAGFTAAEWETRRVLLLDKEHRIIASSDDQDFLQGFAGISGGAVRGCLAGTDGARIGFAQTLGYEEYDGLGWYGVVVERDAR